MSCKKSAIECAVSARCRSVCAAWLVAAAGASEGLGQDRDPFDGTTSPDSTVEVSEYMTVDLHVQDEELGNVLQMLSLQSQRNIVVSNDVSATVTANLYDVTFYEALDAILHVNGYGYVERGNFIFVYTLEEIAQIEAAERRPVSKVIRLDYLNANDAAEFVAPLLSEIGQIKTNGDPDTFAIPDNSPIGGETFALQATMVVVDYEENVEEIEALIAQLDTRPSQVLVEATILQTSLTEMNAFGVDFSIIGSLDFVDFIGGPLSTTNSILGGSGAEGGVASNDATSITSSPGNTAGPSTFKLGVIQDDFSVFIRLLDEVTDVTILSRPALLVLNRQPARVLVGERVGFLNTTSTETSTTQTVEFLDTGTQLQFRPFVSDDGMIRMELSPSVSEALIRTATDANGANVSIPDEITQELTTNVMVRDGSTIVLGGLFTEQTTATRRQVPVLGDIPVIGAAFRGHEDETDRAEIIFMIKPTIVRDEQLIEMGERGMAYTERVRAGARSGLLPFSRDRMTAMLNVEAERAAFAGDTSKALWKLRRSLSLNKNQPEALHLRESLLQEETFWPSRSILHNVIDGEAVERMGSMEPVGVERHGVTGEFVFTPLNEDGTPKEGTTDLAQNGEQNGQRQAKSVENNDVSEDGANQIVQQGDEEYQIWPPAPEMAFDDAFEEGDENEPNTLERPSLTLSGEGRGPIANPEDLELTVTITPSNGEQSRRNGTSRPQPAPQQFTNAPTGPQASSQAAWDGSLIDFAHGPFRRSDSNMAATFLLGQPLMLPGWVQFDPSLLVMEEPDPLAPQEPEQQEDPDGWKKPTFTTVWDSLFGPKDESADQDKDERSFTKVPDEGEPNR